jgi:hypothetical protein
MCENGKRHGASTAPTRWAASKTPFGDGWPSSTPFGDGASTALSRWAAPKTPFDDG